MGGFGNSNQGRLMIPDCTLSMMFFYLAEPLDILEAWVVELFSNIKEGFQSKIDVQKDLPIWKASKLYRLEAVKDVNILNLTWILPCLSRDYLKKPEDYLAHILGHGKLFVPWSLKFQ